MSLLPALPRLVCRRCLDGDSVALVDTVTGTPPAQATRVRAAWDAHTLRVLFDCDDALPWATLRERDAALWTEEVVEIFIDPVGDGASYFEIEINPLGAICDLVLRRIRNGWRKDFAWHVAGLRAHAHWRPGGWTAELVIPFAALVPESPVAGSTNWRVNFFRIDRPGGTAESAAELSAWSPTGLRNFHRPERFGSVHFAE
ncbi:MAG: carbohydrate-binding family 9-like protein [Verrucomicrobia bacterium]|nr:carbohydrate-binding family 9-like protein [Verrucomicrobiota bacterium]